MTCETRKGMWIEGFDGGWLCMLSGIHQEGAIEDVSIKFQTNIRTLSFKCKLLSLSPI